MTDPSRPGSDAHDGVVAAPNGEPGELDEAILAKVSDYLDGALTGAERAEVERQIAGEPAWQRAHAELTETRNFLSGLRKAHAPAGFAEDVAKTIHKRSAGRLFARRGLGDRVPFGALLAVALISLVVIGYVLWASTTGSLKVDRARDPPPRPGSAVVLPP
jgi:anti-sigma factor RsiW